MDFSLGSVFGFKMIVEIFRAWAEGVRGHSGTRCMVPLGRCAYLTSINCCSVGSWRQSAHLAVGDSLFENLSDFYKPPQFRDLFADHGAGVGDEFGVQAGAGLAVAFEEAAEGVDISAAVEELVGGVGFSFIQFWLPGARSAGFVHKRVLQASACLCAKNRRGARTYAPARALVCPYKNAFGTPEWACSKRCLI